MKTIIQIIGLADGRLSEFDGMYIKSYNPTENDLGVGTVHFTADAKLAQRFDDFAAAVEFWRQQSRTVPLRPDGKPNRPLTSFTVTMEHINA